MNLYLISQSENNDYDTHDDPWNTNHESTWCSTPDDVKVELVGTAKEGTIAGIVLASFNAG